MNHILGGKVEKAPVREYGKTEVFVDKSSPLFLREWQRIRQKDLPSAG